MRLFWLALLLSCYCARAEVWVTPLPVVNISKSTPSYTQLIPRDYLASGQKLFVFDPKLLTWFAYAENGELIKSGRASGGRAYCQDTQAPCQTPTGEFNVYYARGEDCESSQFPLGEGGAPMPYCMFFHRGFAIHGADSVPGYNASHGCIRVFKKAAQWLHESFIRLGTKVIIRSY